MSNIFLFNNSIYKYKKTNLIYTGNNKSNNNIDFIRHFPPANIE